LLGIQKRLNNESFLDKAPEDVIAKVKSQHVVLEETNEKLVVNLERIKAMK